MTHRNAAVSVAERPWPRRIAKLLVLAQVMYPLAGIAPAHAQSQPAVALAPSRNAPAGQRPIIDAAQNGVPIVHIAPPSAGGVSRNQYEQFNVGTNGLILNNSSANVQTQLGGWISGNLQLGPTPARIILNEVVAGGPSQLKGFVEVAGQRADIVIANPNGISCDGCGFLNTNGRATLTTGVPQIGGNGELRGFNVGQGEIHIGSGGLNATNLEQLDLVARGLVIEGEVWAKNLQVVAGANQVLYGTLAANTQSGTGTAPSFAIDIKALGGMYANQIYLVATEQGLGVNSTGRIAALQGNLSLSANGDLSLKDSYAKQDLQFTSSGSTTLSGVTQSEGRTQVRTAGSLTQQGVVASTGPLDVVATGLNNTGTLYSASALNVAAAQLNDTNGKLISAGDLSIAAQAVALNGTQISTDAKVTLAASAGDVSLAKAQVYAGSDIAVNASSSVANSGGFVQAGGSIAVQAGSVANRGGTVLASGALRVSTPGAIDNTGGKLMGGTAVDLSAASLVNDTSTTSQALVASDQGTRIATTGAAGVSNRGGVLSGKTELVVTTGGATLANAGGTLVSDNALRIASGHLDNTAGQIVSRALQDARAALAIDATSVDNRRGLVDAGATLQLGSAGAVQNQGGTIQSGTSVSSAAGQGGLVLQSASLDNSAGQVLSRDVLVLGTGSLVNEARGVIASTAASTAVQSTALSNQGGLIASATGTAVSSQALNNTGGEIGSAAALTLTTNGQALTNSAGRIAAQGALDLRTGTLSNEAGASIVANGTLAIAATGLSNRGSTLSSAGDANLSLGADALDNGGGNIAVGSRLSVSAGAVSNRAGRIVANQSVAVDAAGLDNTGGVVSAADAVRVASAGAVVNADGQLSSKGSVRVAAGSLDNARGSVSAATTELRLGTGSLLNTHGQIVGSQSLALQSGAIGNAGGVLVTGGGLAIDTAGQGFDNAGGTLQIGGALSVASARLDNARGTINANVVDLQLGNGTLNNDGGSITSAQALGLRAGQLSNQAGRISSNGSTRIDSQALNNQGGELSSGATLAVDTQGQALDNTGGTISAANAVSVANAGSVVNTRGRITSNGTVDLAATDLTNEQGTISAQDTRVRLGSGALVNRQGTLVGAQALVLQSGAIDNTGGTIATSAALALDTAGQDLDNSGGSVQAGGALSIAAGRLVNAGGGTFSSAGTVNLLSRSLDNRGGRIVSGQALTVDTQGGSLVNDGGAMSSAQSLALDAGTLSNQGGVLASAAAGRIGSQALNNSGGEISSGTALSLDTNGQGLTNTGGRITAQTALDLNAGAIVNEASASQAGLIASNGTLSVRASSLSNRGASIASVFDAAIALGAGALDNTGGTLTTAGRLTLSAGAVTNGATANAGGVISAQGALQATLASLDNTQGQLVAGGASLLATSGALVNDQGRIATNADLTLAAANLSNRAGQIGATQTASISVGPSGTLSNDAGSVQAGALTVDSGALSNGGGLIASNTTLALNTHGQGLNNSGGTIQAITSVDLQAGQTGNGSGRVLAGQSLTLTTLALTNTAGEIASSGSASITTQGQSLVNDTGRITAGTDLALSAGVLVNAQAGLIAANRDAAFSVSSLANSGSLQAARDLSVAASGTAVNSGSLTAQRTLGLEAAALDNRSGQIVAAGDATLALGSGSGSLDNDGGTIASAQALAFAAGSTSNRLGQIVGGSGLVAITQAFDNNAGVIGSQAALSLSTQAFTNSGGTLQALGDLGLSATAISNTGGGRILANQALTLTASSVDNTGGSLSAGTRLGLTASGALANGQGRITAGGNADISAASLSSNAQGLVSAAQALSVDTASGALNNAGGTLVAASGVQLGSGALDNRAGTIASTQGSLAVDTRGQSLANDGGALQAFGNATLTTGALSNQAGVVSGQDVSLAAAGVNNDNGAVVAKGALGIGAQSLSNRSGLLQSAAALTLALGGDLDNRGGSIVANGDLTLTAATLNNSGAGSGILAANIVINAASIDNSAGGGVSARNDATLGTASLDNTGGNLSAKGRLSISATSLANTNGQIVGDGGVTVNTSSSALGGSIASASSVTLNIAGSYTNTGLLSVRDSLSINATDITNSGTLHADQALSLSAGNVSNSGEISAQRTTVHASGTLSNGGLIDGTSTLVTAGTLNNTGRIYGDALAVGGGSVNNSGSGVIAARDSLSLGATALSNTAGGLIYAINDIAIGGALDAQGGLLGSMQSLLSASSTIEAGRDLSIAATTLVNRNDGLTTTQVSDGPTAQPVMLQPSGWTDRYPLSRFIGVGGDSVQFIVYPDVYGKRSTMLPATTDVPMSCTSGDSGGDCTPGYTIVNYAWNSPAFAQFGVTPVSGPPPAEPGGGCTVTSYGGGDSGTTTTSDVNSPACNQWRSDTANWNGAFGATLSALGAQIDAYNASVNHDNSTVAFEDYTLYNLSSTTTRTQIVTSAPAKLLAGRDLSLSGGTVNNLDSQIVAGRNLFVTGASVNNIATTGTTTTTVSGTAQFSHLDSCGTFGGSHCRNTDGAVAYNPAPTTTHPDLATVVYLASGANPTGAQNLTGSSTSADTRSAGNAGSATGGGAGAAVNAATGSTQSAGQLGAGGSVGGSVQVGSVGTHAVAAQTANVARVQAVGAGTPQAVDTSTGRVSIGTIVRPGSISVTAATAPRLAAPVVQRVSATGSGERARDVILTVVPRLSLPTSSLFTIHTAPGAKYLVETDPRFTNGQTFLSSDYFLAQLKLDPERTLTRYGDGFEEQQLLNDQVLTLTGRRYLSGYSSTQDEYAALMNAGVAFAQQYQLTPGVALSAEQMALLSTDIVWLTTQTVTLADGSTREVLVPQLYIRRPQAQDLSTSGALMAGSNVFIQTTGDLVNKGAIQGDTVTLAAGNDLVNSGTVRGQDVYARAERDLSNLGGSVLGTGDASTLAFSAGRDIVLQTTTQTSSNADGSSTRTNVDRIATVQGGNVSFEAARDFIAQGASVGAGQDLQASAGRDLVISAVQGSYQIDVQGLNGSTSTQGRSGYIKEASTTQQQSTFTAGNNLSLVAQGDVAIKGSTLTAANDAYIQGANVSIEAAKSSQSIDVQTVQERSYDRAGKSDETLVGGVITAGNTLSISATGAGIAGQGDLTLQGATLAAKGQALLSANNDLKVLDASTAHSSSFESYLLDKGLLKSVDTTTGAQSRSSLSQGSTITGGLTALVAGNDLGIQGGQVSGKDGVLLSAGRNLVITEGRSTSDSSSRQDVHTTGLQANSIGAIQLGGSAGDERSGARSTESVNASSVSSSQGNVRITSGGLTALQGVQVQAQGDVAISGADVSISGAAGADKTTAERSTHGTQIDMTGWHDLGKGINAQRTETNTEQNTGLVRSTLSGSSVSISATGGNGASGDITLAGASITAPVVNLSAAGSLNLNVQTTQSLTDHSVQGRDLGWQAMGSKGQSSDNVAYNQIDTASLNVAAKTINVQVAQPPAAASAAGASSGRGTAIDPKGLATTQAPVLTPEQQLQSTVDTLKTQPGMAWMGQLPSDPALQANVNWAAVTQAHDSWDYQHQGLTPEGAAIITVVVAYFTAGAASGLGTAAAGGVGATGATATVVAGATTAAVSTLASQAAVALINNKGDIGAALHDMGSSANVKSLVTSIVTGGVLAGLNMNPTGGATAGSGADKFMTQLGQNLQAGAAKAVINTAIYGNSLEDNLKSELKGALISTAAAQTANAIGDANFDTVTNKLAHAIAGCAAGAATAGNGSGCSAGALGAAIGEISAELYGAKSDTVQFASMMSGIAGAVAGVDVNTASAAGGNAAANNYLNHNRPNLMKTSEQEQLDAATRACAAGTAAGACDQAKALLTVSLQRDTILNNTCAAGMADQCNALIQEAVSYGNTVVAGSDGKLHVYPSGTPMASAGTSVLDNSFDQQVSKSTAEGLLLESGNQMVVALIGVAAKGISATRIAVGDVFASQGIQVDATIVARIANNFGRDGDQFTVFADQLVRAESAGWVTAEGRVWWPPGGGAVPGTKTGATLQVGQRLDRYGGTSDTSSFLAPTNVSLDQRALSPTTNTAVYDEYIVLKPIPVEQSNVAPWFGKPGMGVQYDTSKGIGMSIVELTKQGYLKKVGS